MFYDLGCVFICYIHALNAINIILLKYVEHTSIAGANDFLFLLFIVAVFDAAIQACTILRVCGPIDGLFCWY